MHRVYFFIRTKHFLNNQIVFLGLLQTEMTHFRNLSYSSTSEISPEQGSHFLGGAFPYRPSYGVSRVWNGRKILRRWRMHWPESLELCDNGNTKHSSLVTAEVIYFHGKTFTKHSKSSFMKESLFDDLNILMIAWAQYLRSPGRTLGISLSFPSMRRQSSSESNTFEKCNLSVFLMLQNRHYSSCK